MAGNQTDIGESEGSGNIERKQKSEELRNFLK
jgi:hypothetical protein